MYLLSQLWLYLAMACLAGASFGFALRLLCSRRAHEAQLQALRDATETTRKSHAVEVAGLLEQQARLADELRRAQAAELSARQDAAQSAERELADLRDRLHTVMLNKKVELDTLHTALAANDEQLAVLSARARVDRERKEALETALATCRGGQAQLQQEAQQRIEALQAELERLRVGLVPAQAAPAWGEARLASAPPPVSPLALMSAAEVEQQVLAAGHGQPPVGLADHGQETADDLKTLDGIGPVNEAWLHGLGVRCFWQIAAWSVQEVAWVAQHLPHFGSRVYRENWVAQAARLAQQARNRP